MVEDWEEFYKCFMDHCEVREGDEEVRDKEAMRRCEEE
jgi:hypothetical protein